MTKKPKNPEKLYNLANQYNKRKEYSKVINTLKKALKINPKVKAAWNNLGTAYANIKEFDNAIRAYQNAIKIDKKYKDAWRNLGIAYSAMEFNVKAIKALMNAVKIDPHFKYAWNNLGIVYGKNKELNNAINAFKKATDIDPNYKDALMNLGIAYKELDGEKVNSIKKNRGGRVMFTRPIIKNGNWSQLKTIEDDKITTEIVLFVSPDFEIKSGDYKIGTLTVNLEVNDNIILRVNAKIIEIEYDINKMPGKEPMPQEIPSNVVHWMNEILKRNNIPLKSHFNDTNWTTIIVNYKLKDKIIATAEYPKMKSI